jgi:F-type H+-transporting ATPase subunit epsilon
MAGTFSVSIMTPEKTLYDGVARSLVLPADRGYMGILAHHAPIVGRVRPGTIRITDDAGADKVLTSRGDGFFEFSGNAATLLLER